MGKQVVTIMLVDDHNIFRVGLEFILSNIAQYKIVGSYGAGKTLMAALGREVPDLIFMDIKLPDSSGIVLTRQIKQQYPGVKIIALTMFGEIEYFNEMIDVGADGFLLKSTDIDEIKAAISSVVKGGTYFAPEFIGHLNRMLNRSDPSYPEIHLSERELQVLKLICEGYSNSEIAKKLFISTHTVDSHRRNLISKTGVKNAPNLVMFALKNGLIR